MPRRARVPARASVRPATAVLAAILCTASALAADPPLAARLDPVTGQAVLSEHGRPVLQYNLRPVEPGKVWDSIAEANRIYAVARGDYLHPLYGLEGEVLTRDWSPDHPHHRGVYWAWPEVEFGARRGDLHALQRVWARPVGEARLRTGPRHAEVEADHDWVWEDGTRIVRERARIRAHAAEGRGRAIDLEFAFTALVPGITIARRDTRLYGGLSLRLATPEAQVLAVHTDPAGASPRRAWSDLSGRFQPGRESGLTVLPHRDNPGAPADWIQYPELSWCQPAFPTAGTRHPLSTEHPLVLRYRLWVHAGPAPDPAEAAALWEAYHAPPTDRTPPPP